jgi:hypothetical protein
VGLLLKNRVEFLKRLATIEKSLKMEQHCLTGLVPFDLEFSCLRESIGVFSVGA